MCAYFSNNDLERQFVQEVIKPIEWKPFTKSEVDKILGIPEFKAPKFKKVNLLK